MTKRIFVFFGLAWAFSANGCSSCDDGAAAVGSEATKLLPAYSIGVMAVKSLPELTSDIGLGGMLAAGGADAQRGWAAITGILGFDPANPQTMAQTGLDPATPVVVGVTRYQGEATTPVLFVRCTDPAVATNYLLQKAPLAGIQITGQMPMGSHTVYVGSGESAVAATTFDKIIAIAIGSPQSQPMGAIQELIGVEGGQTPNLASQDGYKQAMERLGNADVIFYMNVPQLVQALAAAGLGADEQRMANELRRFAAIAAALEIQGGVASLRGYTATAPGAISGPIFSDDASDVQVLDRIGGQALFSMRATLNLPSIWAQFAPQMPELNEARQGLMEMGLNLDNDVVGMLSGTFSVTGFRIGESPTANDFVITAGITDPNKVTRIVQVLTAQGMAPTSVPVGGSVIHTWNMDQLNVSMAVMGNQMVVGVGRDANGMSRILMGAEGPSFRTQIPDPGVAERYGKGGNGAAFVNLGALMQQIAAMDPDVARYQQVTAMVQSLGLVYEAAPGGFFGSFDLRLVQGQTIAGWLAALVQISAMAPPPPPPPPPMPFPMTTTP